MKALGAVQLFKTRLMSIICDNCLLHKLFSLYLGKYSYAYVWQTTLDRSLSIHQRTHHRAHPK